MDINSKRQLSQLRKEVESIEGFNLDFAKFEKLIQQHENEIISGQRRVDSELKICETIRQLRLAISHRNHHDVSVQRWAQEAMEDSRHNFRAVNSSLKHFISALEDAFDNEQGDFSPEIIVLGDGYQLEEIVSLSRLMELGKLFDNCVSSRDTAKVIYERSQRASLSNLGAYAR